MPNIDRYGATATVADSVLTQHGMKSVDTQRNSLPLVADQKVGGPGRSPAVACRVYVTSASPRECRRWGTSWSHAPLPVIGVCFPSQTVVDLLTGPGRYPAEAEALLEWMERNLDAWRR